MKSYSPAETCMLLLCAMLDDGKPISLRLYQKIFHALEAIGAASDEMDAQLSEAELHRLGLSPEETKLVLRRLSCTDALKKHLDILQKHRITVLTRISPEYPQRLRMTLGDYAPLLLYCTGNIQLFQSKCVALVGSRQIREAGQNFAQTLGQTAAAEGFTYVSGGAPGADTIGFASAIKAGGNAVIFLADSLQKRMLQMEDVLFSNRLLLVSEGSYDLPFSALRAYSRNRLIHAMGEKVFVAQSDYGSGGTWNGVTENLKAGWSPVYVCSDEEGDTGARGLIERGCQAISASELCHLQALEPAQTRLF